MKKSILFILICALLLTLLSCKHPTPEGSADTGLEVDENGYVTIEIAEIAEKKEVNLDHPLYVGRYDDFDVYGLIRNGKVKVKSEMYQSLEYTKQGIRSAEQAVAYYQSIDPWNLISEKCWVIVDISYDAKYDVWAFSLVREENREHFYAMDCFLDCVVHILLDGNGQFVCRVD